MHPFEYRGLATHEFGHAFGLSHVGNWDSYRNDNKPAMGSCTFGNGPTTKQDDNASVQLQTDVNGEWRSATANSSFEEDDSYKQYWGIKSGSQTAKYSGGADGSPYYMRFRHPSSQGVLWSTTSLNTGATPVTWVKARANYKKFSRDHIGTVRMMLRVRTYHNTDAMCGFPERRLGHHTYPGAPRFYSKHCTPGLGWGYCTTAGENPPEVGVQLGGVEVRVYVMNNVVDDRTGIRMRVGVDRALVLVHN